jgi:hypothetical protein
VTLGSKFEISPTPDPARPVELKIGFWLDPKPKLESIGVIIRKLYMKVFNGLEFLAICRVDIANGNENKARLHTTLTQLHHTKVLGCLFNLNFVCQKFKSQNSNS